jgi:radical SAM protein with 4Fe4S-binding SPASM domain
MRTYEEEKDFRWCAAGKYMSCVGMNGTEYACQVFMPSVQADTHDVLERKKRAQALLRNAAADITDPVCKKCEIYSACPTCYGMNFVDRKDLGNKGQDNCTFAMIRVKASAYLFGSMLANEEAYPYMKAMSDHRKLRLIEAIETIEEAIPNQILTKKIRGEIKGMGL